SPGQHVTGRLFGEPGDGAVRDRPRRSVSYGVDRVVESVTPHVRVRYDEHVPGRVAKPAGDRSGFTPRPIRCVPGHDLPVGVLLLVSGTHPLPRGFPPRTPRPPRHHHRHRHDGTFTNATSNTCPPVRGWPLPRAHCA